MSNPKDVDKKFRQLVAAETKHTVQHFAYTASALFFTVATILAFLGVWTSGGISINLWESSILSLVVSGIMLKLGIWLRGSSDVSL